MYEYFLYKYYYNSYFVILQMILSKTYVMEEGDCNEFHDFVIEDIKKYFNNTDRYKFSITIKCIDIRDNNEHFFTINMYIDREVKSDIEDEKNLHIIDIEKDYECVFSNNESMKIIFDSDLKDINKNLYIRCRPLTAMLKRINQSRFQSM